MGRLRKIKSVKQMEEAWEEYKADCDNKRVLTHNFNPKTSKYVSAELKHRITYTIEGFCVFIGIARSNFYEFYANNPNFRDTVTRMREECEVDARKKFELQEIPSHLAGLWMSNYGYKIKTDNDISSSVPIIITGSDKLED